MEVGEKFAGVLVGDDVAVVDEHFDWGSCVGSPDPYVVLFAVGAEGKFAEMVDFVVANAWTRNRCR